MMPFKQCVLSTDKTVLEVGGIIVFCGDSSRSTKVRGHLFFCKYSANMHMRQSNHPWGQVTHPHTHAHTRTHARTHTHGQIYEIGYHCCCAQTM